MTIKLSSAPPVAQPAERKPLTEDRNCASADASADANFASGMLLGWNLCAVDDIQTFSAIREQRMRAAAASAKERAHGIGG